MCFSNREGQRWSTLIRHHRRQKGAVLQTKQHTLTPSPVVVVSSPVVAALFSKALLMHPSMKSITSFTSRLFQSLGTPLPFENTNREREGESKTTAPEKYVFFSGNKSD